jgi:hypothetical protein
MGALTDLWKSERGLLAVVLIIAATVLAGLDRMTTDAWRDFSLYVFGIYATGKTLTGAVAIMKGSTDPAPLSSPATAPTPAAPTPAGPA